MPDLKINPRQWVAAGFHVISKITKGFRSRAAEPADTGLKIFAYHGDDLVSIAHKHNIFRGLLNKSRRGLKPPYSTGGADRPLAL